MNRIKYVIILVVFLSLSFTIYKADSKNFKNDYVKVVYFHGDYRCATCQKIERYTKEAVKTLFAKELKCGKVKLQVINFNKEENEHYLDDYELYNQALIISIYKNGREIKWKNCEKIWTLVNDKGEYFTYIKKEVDKYLKAE